MLVPAGGQHLSAALTVLVELGPLVPVKQVGLCLVLVPGPCSTGSVPRHPLFISDLDQWVQGGGPGTASAQSSFLLFPRV